MPGSDNRALTRPPTATVLSYYTSIDSGDIDAALGCFDAGATYRRPGYPPMHGIDSIRAYYRTSRVIRSGRHEIEHVISDGDHVAVCGSFTGRSHADDPLQVRFSDVWRFDGGQVVERETFFDAPAV